MSFTHFNIFVLNVTLQSKVSSKQQSATHLSLLMAPCCQPPPWVLPAPAAPVPPPGQTHHAAPAMHKTLTQSMVASTTHNHLFH